MTTFEVEFLDAIMARVVREITTAIKQSEMNIMATNQAALDAVIAALPTQIETAVETAMQPVIAAIIAAAQQNGVDLTTEVTQLQAIPAAVASGIAAALTPATPAASTPA